LTKYPDDPKTKINDIITASIDVDFSNPFFQASAKGQGRIRACILLRANEMSLADVSSEEDRKLLKSTFLAQ
jgi:hypothetical protein